IALGDCACDCGMFKGSYAVTGPVERHVPVAVKVPGCPPRPAEILQALLCLMGQAGRMSAVMLLAGLVGLWGCSQKSVTATTSGMEATQGAARPGAGTDEPRRPADSRPVEPGAPPPLQGFSSPSRVEEVITAPAPIVVAKAEQPAGAPASAATRRVLADIYFAFDKWALSKEGKKNLAQSAEVLKQSPSAKLLIEGHCDERGSREYNLVLGEKRAHEARRYLEALGIKNPVTVTSYGKERPVCAEHNESCYWKNRRAHLVREEGR
ncbi:MAG: OmpA family protein, partial [Chloroflexota bacterium]